MLQREEMSVDLSPEPYITITDQTSLQIDVTWDQV